MLTLAKEDGAVAMPKRPSSPVLTQSWSAGTFPAWGCGQDEGRAALPTAEHSSEVQVLPVGWLQGSAPRN